MKFTARNQHATTEIAGKAKLIVDFDQEVGQFHAAHVLRQPGFKVGQTVLSFLIQFLGRLGGSPG